MGFLDPMFIGIFAAKVANRLIDLGIDVNKLEPALGQILYEIESTKRKELSSSEAAAYFFAVAFSNIPTECYLLPIAPSEMAFRASAVMKGWVSKRKMSEQWFMSIQKTMRSQL